MTKKILSFVTAAVLVAATTCTGVRAEGALNTQERAHIAKALENVQAIALQAKAAGLTQDQAAALIAQHVQNTPELSDGFLSGTQQKILLAAIIIMVGAYLGISIYQKTPLFWNWKWSENEDEISVFERHFKEKKAIINEAMENVIKKASGDRRMEAKMRACLAEIQTTLDKASALELEMAKLSKEEKLKRAEAEFNKLAQRINSFSI